jgi:hypothetical protein
VSRPDARNPDNGYWNRHQRALGLIDLELHRKSSEAARSLDVVAVSHGAFARASVAPPPDGAESVQNILGRPRCNRPFFECVGLRR